VSYKQQNLLFEWKENHTEEDQALGYIVHDFHKFLERYSIHRLTDVVHRPTAEFTYTSMLSSDIALLATG